MQPQYEETFSDPHKDALILSPTDEGQEMVMLGDDGKVYIIVHGEWTEAGIAPKDTVDVVMSKQGIWCFDRNGKALRWNEQLNHSNWIGDEPMRFTSGGFELKEAASMSLPSRAFNPRPGTRKKNSPSERTRKQRLLVVFAVLVGCGLLAGVVFILFKWA